MASLLALCPLQQNFVLALGLSWDRGFFSLKALRASCHAMKAKLPKSLISSRYAYTDYRHRTENWTSFRAVLSSLKMVFLRWNLSRNLIAAVCKAFCCKLVPIRYVSRWLRYCGIFIRQISTCLQISLNFIQMIHYWPDSNESIFYRKYASLFELAYLLHESTFDSNYATCIFEWTILNSERHTRYPSKKLCNVPLGLLVYSLVCVTKDVN